ncbi:hypothetical protein [Thalassotalea sp. PS06]|uniref:hypothetical protein n=1 Tax=Thalassotalea sp. PS06 TaxID=2594005 RepID=UPI00163D884B|nr:hypothetical protein [Thalassotalea sp. PS06]
MPKMQEQFSAEVRFIVRHILPKALFSPMVDGRSKRVHEYVFGSRLALISSQSWK